MTRGLWGGMGEFNHCRFRFPVTSDNCVLAVPSSFITHWIKPHRGLLFGLVVFFFIPVTSYRQTETCDVPLIE